MDLLGASFLEARTDILLQTSFVALAEFQELNSDRVRRNLANHLGASSDGMRDAREIEGHFQLLPNSRPSGRNQHHPALTDVHAARAEALLRLESPSAINTRTIRESRVALLLSQHRTAGC